MIFHYIYRQRKYSSLYIDFIVSVYMGIHPLKRGKIFGGVQPVGGWGQHRKHKKAYCLLSLPRIFFKQKFLTQPAGKTKCLWARRRDYIVRDVTQGHTHSLTQSQTIPEYFAFTCVTY